MRSAGSSIIAVIWELATRLPLICKLQREGASRQIELHFLRYP